MKEDESRYEWQEEPSWRMYYYFYHEHIERYLELAGCYVDRRNLWTEWEGFRQGISSFGVHFVFSASCSFSFSFSFGYLSFVSFAYIIPSPQG